MTIFLGAAPTPVKKQQWLPTLLDKKGLIANSTTTNCSIGLSVNILSKSSCYVALLALGCSSPNVPKGTPDCIEDRIRQIQQASVWNPPAKVYSYQYRGQTVYYIPPRCCDIPSVLLDENCNALCSPDGGFSGGGDGKCTDFFSARSDGRLIWEDTRK